MRHFMQIDGMPSPEWRTTQSEILTYFRGILDGIALYGPGRNELEAEVVKLEYSGIDARLTLPDGRTLRYWSEEARETRS